MQGMFSFGALGLYWRTFSAVCSTSIESLPTTAAGKNDSSQWCRELRLHLLQ